MTNALAVPAVTAVLASIAQDAVGKLDLAEPPTVTVGPLDNLGAGADGPTVGVHLYRVAPSPSAATSLPTRSVLKVAPRSAAFDLHYLQTFRGSDEWQSQQLLAATAVALHAEPILTAARMASAEADHPEIADSCLASADEHVRITMGDLSLDELTRLWALYPPGSFALSLAVMAGPVMLALD